MKEFLSEKGVDFYYADISKSMADLKAFLKIRDTSSRHEEARALHYVGIPCLSINDGEEIYIAESREEAERLYNEGLLK